MNETMEQEKWIEWLNEKINYAEGYRNHVPKTKDENKYWDGKIAAFNEVKEKAEDDDPWIEVDQRLPSERPGWSNSEDVNICWIDETGNPVVSTGSYSYHFNKWVYYLYHGRKEKITHWRPFPSPPINK